MAKFKKLANVHEGKIVYFDEIVSGIVLLAVSEIPYVELYSKETNSLNKNNAIKVKIDKSLVHIDIVVKIHYSQSVSDTAFKIQEAIRHNIETMTEYTVASVNVNISGVTFEDINVPTTNKQEENVENAKEEQKEV